LPNPSLFTHTTALITGASRGIGAAFAEILSTWGTDLVLVARNEEDLTDVAGKAKANGVRVHVVASDLRDAGTPVALVERLDRDGVTIDHLINNAGIGPFGNAAAVPVEQQLSTIQVNVVATTELTLRLLPGMIERARGGILNVASTAAFQGMPHMSVYGGSKSYILSWSEAIWRELRGTGVRCCSVCPGPTETEFFEANGFRIDIPPVLFQAPERVALLGLNAYIKDQSHAVSGLTNRVGSLAVRFSPRTLATRIAGTYAKPL
jgi:short-subunit dehydrogenase